MSTCGACGGIGPNGAPIGGGGSSGPSMPTSLDQAIILQAATPTTPQGFDTTIRLGDTFGWVFTDAGGVALLAVRGDGVANGLTYTGGSNALGGGQGASFTTGPSTTAGQASGSFNFITGAVTDADTGSINFVTPAAVGTNRAAGDFNVTLGSGTGTAEGGDFTVVCGAGGTSGSGGDFDVSGGAGGTTGSGGLCARRGGVGGSTTGAGGNIVDNTGDGGAGGSNAGQYSFNGGFGQAGNATGGGGIWTGGNSVGTGRAGSFVFNGGPAPGGGQGGTIELYGGASTVPGYIILLAGSGSSGNANGTYVSISPGNGIGTGSAGVIRLLGRPALQRVQSPAALAASVNNLGSTPIGAVNWLRLTPAAGGTTITGIVAALEDGVILCVTNINAVDTITLAHDSASSTAANRIFAPNNASFALLPQASTLLIYDLLLTHWRVLND